MYEENYLFEISFFAKICMIMGKHIRKLFPIDKIAIIFFQILQVPSTKDEKTPVRIFCMINKIQNL